MPSGNSLDLQWTIQHRITSEHKSLYGKRPDLLGSGSVNGEPVLLIFENKIDAAIGEHSDSDGTTRSQLETYFHYLHEESASYRGLFFVSRSGVVQADLCPEVREAVYPASWRQLADAILEVTARSDVTAPATAYLGGKFEEVLEDFGMASISISATHVTAYEAWKHTRQICEELSNVWHLWSTLNVGKRLEAAGFGFTSGHHYGVWNWKQRGSAVCLMTAKEDQQILSSGDSYVHVYAGVLLEGIETYVEPKYPGLPSLAMGIALCLQRTQWSGLKNRLSRWVDGLNELTLQSDAGWSLRTRNEDGEDPDWSDAESRDWMGVNLVRELSFMDALYTWGETWHDEPEKFFRQGFAAMEASMSEEDLTFLRALHDQAKALDK